MYFLPLQQDFYSKSRHASPPQNSSQIYAYGWHWQHCYTNVFYDNYT